MQKLRLSFTLLNYWDSNNLTDLINFYFKVGSTTVRPGMELGSKYDKLNEQSILIKNKFIDEFGGDTLKQPIPKFKLVGDVDETIEVVGELDCYDSGTIFETKVGSSSDSADYSSSAQLCFYFWLLKAHDLPVEKAIIVHFDPTTRQTDRTLLWNTEEQIKRFENIVETKGRMIYKYFQTEGLL